MSQVQQNPLLQSASLAERLRPWLQAQLPAAEGLTLDNFSSPDAGESNITILFDAHWREQGQPHQRGMVLRTQAQGAAGVFPHYDLALQYRAMALLQGSEVRVPELLGWEQSAALLGSPFYVMWQLPGRVIAEQPPYHMAGWFTEIDAAERGAIWRAAIAAIASVNRQDWRALGFDFLLPAAGESCLQQQLRSYEHFLGWTEAKGGRSYPVLRGMYRWLQQHMPQDEPVALCWGDAKPANLLLDGSQVSGVLDWELVHLGNPVDDLAWWITLDNSMSEGLERLVGMAVPKQSGLPSQAEMIAQWEQASGFSARDFDYYEVFGAFKFGIIMTSIGINLTRAGIMPEEIQMEVNHTCTPLMDRLVARHGIVVD